MLTEHSFWLTTECVWLKLLILQAKVCQLYQFQFSPSHVCSTEDYATLRDQWVRSVSSPLIRRPRILMCVLSSLVKVKVSFLSIRSPQDQHSNALRYFASLCGGLSREILFSCLLGTNLPRLTNAKYQEKRVWLWHVSLGANSLRLLQRLPRMLNPSSWTLFAYCDKLMGPSQGHQHPLERRSRSVLSCRVIF